MRNASLRPALLPLVAVTLVLALGSGIAHSAPQYSPLNGVRGTVKIRGQATLDQRIEVALLTSDGRPREKVFTDSLGNFQFMSVGPGAYIIVIDVPGYRRIEERVEITGLAGRNLTQRNFVLEPLATRAASSEPATVSAGKFLVSRDAREAYEKAEKELNRRQYVKAAKHLESVLAIAPDFADGWYLMGLIQLQQDLLPQAQQHFEKAVAANPQLGDAQIGMGAALVRQGNAQAAVEPLSKGLLLSPKSYLGHFERCRAYFGLNQFVEAEADCLRAREVAEGSRPELNILLGNLYARSGRKHEAIREFENYLKLDGQSSTAAQVRDVIKSLRESK